MSYKKLIFLIGLALIVSSVSMAQTYKYIGANGCKACHNKVEKGEQFNKWSTKDPHSKAMNSLKGAEKNDPKCLKCHSTAASVDKSLITSTISVDEGVSCESCHGPGSAYKNATIMKNRQLALTRGMIMPEEKVCRQCHNQESPTFKGFNYKEYVARISHDDPTTK